MKTSIALYNRIKEVVLGFSQSLRFGTFLKTTGRKLALSIEDIVAAAIFKHRGGIETKKQTYEILQPRCSYKTFVVNINRWSFLSAIILALLLKMNRANQHPIKHIDSTDIPVCLFKNANAHKTMKGLARFGRSSKGIYFGLKMHLISDLERKLLKVRFTAANVDDREVVLPMSEEIWGLLIADAGYVSAKLERDFNKEGKRAFMAMARKNMRKLMTAAQLLLYRTRMLIELNFRNLKMFHGLITSLPRSVDGYLANYIHSLLASQIA